MIYDLIIIGGGPAGLSAAIYSLRANKKVLVIEKEVFGGQITKTPLVENYPGIKNISGIKLADSMFEQATSLGMESIYQEVISINKENNLFNVKTSTKVYQSKALIVATGSNHRNLNINNEEKFLGAGISYCATCDGAFFKNQKVAVVGGGNTAISDALYLADICETVYLIHRREQFRAEETKVALLKSKKNVIFLTNQIITELNGSSSLEEITVQNIINSEKTNLKITGLFVAIGQIPNTQLLEPLIDLAADKSAISANNCQTNLAGLFVAGDLRDKKIRQLTTATSDGTIAAMSAIEYLENL